LKIKRIKSLKVNCYAFKVKWDQAHCGGFFSYADQVIEIGTKGESDSEIFRIICHELAEITAIEMGVRLNRPDCDSDYVFVYDHRQHETMTNMFSGLVSQFIE